MTTNLADKPYFEVERRKYRFRILNATVSRFFKVALANASGRARPIIQLGEKAYLVNLCEHQNGRKPRKDLPMDKAFASDSLDPCVGKFLEFRIVRNPAKTDQSRVPPVMIPNPDLTNVPVARERTFLFGKKGKISTNPYTSGEGPWGISTDGGNISMRTTAGPRRRRNSGPAKSGISSTTTTGGTTRSTPTSKEGQVLERNGSLANVPLAERGRKDVYRLLPGGTITITMQFRDWGGVFMEHCHNTSTRTTRCCYGGRSTTAASLEP